MRWRRERRRQSNSHQAKVGNEGGEGIPVLCAAKRPPKLQVIRQFEESLSSPSKRNALDHKFIVDRPEGPSEGPNLKPPNVARRQGGVLEFGE